MYDTKEVNFEAWCPKCEYHKLRGCEDPCNECLSVGMNIDSTKPIRFKEAEK